MAGKTFAFLGIHHVNTANLAEYIDEGTLLSLSSELLADYDADIASRREWLDSYVKGLDLLGLKVEERMEPWAGACGVTHPLLIESAVKFQSETIVETFPAMGPVKTVIIGKETPEKTEAAKRVQADMNYRLTEEMKEYRPEHERLLFSLSLAGNAFKKVYFDPALDRQTAAYIPAEDIVVPYGATSLDNAERVTHRMRKTKNELRRLQVAGFYLDADLGDPVRLLDDVEKASRQRIYALEDEVYAATEAASLQQQVNELTLTSAQLRAKEREAVIPANQALFDQVQAATAAKAAEEALAQAQQKIADERAGLQQQLRELPRADGPPTGGGG